jgi:predicted metal-dependent hydrolase
MSQKIVDIPGVGYVLLAKRRGTRSLRLSVQPNGTVRVGMPAWAPYSAGIKFALTRRDWIAHHQKDYRPIILKHGHRIGKSHRLQFVAAPSAAQVITRLRSNTITITSSLEPIDIVVQSRAVKACERALKKEAETLLPDRLSQIAQQYGFTYKKAHIKRLMSRWGSCSNSGLITLNYYLIQLPWHLIDYVLLHELVHTQHMSHGPEFWELFERHAPNAKALRKEIKQYRPILMPSEAHPVA